MPISNYDIMIVGGGPAGISTWLHLNKRAPDLAARTLLIEKAVYPRPKLCGGGVTRQADLILARLRVKIKVPSVRIHNVEFRFGEQTLRFQQRNILRVVRRHEFDHALAQAAVKRGLQLQEDETFLNYEHADGYLKVETSRRQYRVRALIGADGAKSVVRRIMAPAQKPNFSRLMEILTPVDPGQNRIFADNTAVFDFSPLAEGLQGYVWDFPCFEGGAAMMNRGIFDSRVHPDRPRADLKAIFDRELIAREAYLAPKNWAGHPERWFSRENILAQPNVLLTGDAAGVEPAFGEGISQALMYGDVAAISLVNAFKQHDFSFNDYTTQLLLHPLGQALDRQTKLAKKMYAGSTKPVQRLYRLLSRLIIQFNITQGK